MSLLPNVVEVSHEYGTCMACGETLTTLAVVELNLTVGLRGGADARPVVESDPKVLGLKFGHVCGPLADLTRTPICMCSHAVGIHLIERDGRCTARSCDCSGFIGRGQ